MVAMIRGVMGNQNWARLGVWLILISGCLVITLEENLEKDETLFSQFMASSREQVNDQVVVTSSMLDNPRRHLVSRLGSSPSPSPSPSPSIPHKRSRRSRTRSRSPSPQSSFFTPSRSLPPAPTSSNNSTSRKNDIQKTIIIAVAVTAVSTFLFAALFFLCCKKVFGKGSGGRKNDERPLLSLSSSDYSVGSSLNYGGSVQGEKLGHQAFNIYSNHGKMPSFDGSNSDNSDSLEERLSHESIRSNHGILPLKPPPGRSERPPSGKVEPLPPEPPKFLKVSSNTASAPLQPVPPPTMPTSVAPPRPPPPAPPPSSSGPKPPPGGPKPPPGSSGPKPPPPPGLKGPRPPPPMSNLGPKAPRPSSGPSKSSDDNAPKTKLKPFFWDKVQANPDHSMVWNDIRSGSFQFNEEMIESLFGYAAADKNKTEKNEAALPQFVQILEPKKGQNLAILLRALNVRIEEVCDALREGNELPVEFIQTLLKMAPTSDEELKLKLYCGEISQLGSAERFLKAVVDIPFAFKRLEALLFMCTLHEEMAFVKESFQKLEVACKELKGSRLFLKLLEAVLKTGNRMNDGTFRGGAQAFKLDTLLKLADVKGTDGKTTLLHFVVQEIIRTEGIRAARAIRESQSFSSVKPEDLTAEENSEETEEKYRNLGLEKVSGLSNELEHVKKSANIDADSLTGTVLKIGQALSKARDFVNSEMKNSGEESGFREALEDFIKNAEGSVAAVVEEEKRIMALVKSTGDYFHGKAGKDEGLRLFVIVRDFLVMLDKSCKEVREARRKPVKVARKQGSTASASETPRQMALLDQREKLFPAITERRMEQSSSDSD